MVGASASEVDMPDDAKLEAMRARGYALTGSCLTCEHSMFETIYSRWGICTLGEYEHSKHKRKHPYPAHVAFTCEFHATDPRVLLSLGEYASEPWNETATREKRTVHEPGVRVREKKIPPLPVKRRGM